MISSRFATTTALGAVTVLALSACGGASGAGQPPAAPAASAPAASSGPASSAPASQSGGGSKPSTPATQLAITGTVAGLDFTDVGDQARSQAGGIQQMAKGAKVEPASCQKITEYASASDPKTTGSSMAMSGQSAYGVGVASITASLKEMKTTYQGCPKMTMELGGQKIPMEVKVSDAPVPGATDVFTVTQIMDVMGQKVTIHTTNGTVRGLLVTAFASGPGIEQAKVSEVFEAQVAKVASAT